MENSELALHAVVETSVDDSDMAEMHQVLSGRGIDVTFETSDLTATAQGVSATLSNHDPGVEGMAGARAVDWTMMLYGHVNALAKQLGPSDLRDTVEEVRALRAKQEQTSPADGLVLLVDEDTGVRLDLEFQLPLRAYEDLASLSLPTFHADPLRFHRRTRPHGAWRGPH